MGEVCKIVAVMEDDFFYDFLCWWQKTSKIHIEADEIRRLTMIISLFDGRSDGNLNVSNVKEINELEFRVHERVGRIRAK